ncbi:MAG: hypothetical protein RLZZ533_605 [Cyanobacteriota bacterium]
MQALLTRLLLLPLLSPLLAVLLIAAVNPRPWVALRLLTWTSPAWPLGGWLASGLAVGAGLSAAGTALALQGQPSAVRPRRQVRRGAPEAEPEPEPTPRQAPRRSAPWAGPSRSASDPPPTVSVPFRVIRRPQAAASATAAKAPSSPTTTASQADDWDSPHQDDW